MLLLRGIRIKLLDLSPDLNSESLTKWIIRCMKVYPSENIIKLHPQLEWFCQDDCMNSLTPVVISIMGGRCCFDCRLSVCLLVVVYGHFGSNTLRSCRTVQYCRSVSRALSHWLIDWLIDWRFTSHSIQSYFGDVLPCSQSLGLVLKKLKLTQQKQTRMWANAKRDGRLLIIGGALCSMPQSLADAHY